MFVNVLHVLFIICFCSGFVKCLESPPVAGPSADCADKDPKCKMLGIGYQCLLNPKPMRLMCPRTCATGACRDALQPLEFMKAKKRIVGFCTDDGTHHYSIQARGAQFFAQGHFRRDVSMGEYLTPDQVLRSNPWLTLSSLGVGTYLGNVDNGTDHEVVNAILRSVAAGWNVVDTASNYRGGRAEAAVGEALQSITRVYSHGLKRNMLFISTKAGFISRDIEAQLLATGKINKSDIVGSNCIHPECIKLSLDTSLERLQLDTVDILYLHNAAETQMSVLGKDDFFDRLRAAFITLEDLRAAGRIKAYGLASWTCFRVPQSHHNHVALEKLVHLAREVGGKNHGFRYIQLPINIIMREGWEENWQLVNGEEKSAVEAAAILGIGVFASGSLMEGKMLENSKAYNAVLDLPELANVEGGGAKMLQIVRSTPFIIAALVGHKGDQHVVDNLALSKIDPLSKDDFYNVMTQLKLAL